MKAIITIDQEQSLPGKRVTILQMIHTTIIGMKPAEPADEKEFICNRDLGDEDAGDLFEA
ncbi:MAG TPA: hypothetical protein PLD84_11240 [Chitinophagales bacterium]|nr:hypothetical protein [Chitinophagales bacterium]